MSEPLGESIVHAVEGQFVPWGEAGAQPFPEQYGTDGLPLMLVEPALHGGGEGEVVTAYAAAEEALAA
ncbi:hypothetical protein [Streptomyces sp. NPDC059076]|uniref:hypothetical protein n=1 Tax=unclassified Streptomyces TaxID=2593676 RepID=UPI003675E366